MPLDESHCAVTYKVLVLGDFSVGKTALLRSLTGEDFHQDMRPTVGVDFVKKIFEVDGALVQLAIWDSAGQERFRSITKQQYRGVQGLILVYDMTDKNSFETLNFWLNSIQEEMTSPAGRGSYEPTPFVICANKSDLSDKRQVSVAKGVKFSTKEMAFGFYETSAVTGTNVFTAFQKLAYHITDICDPKLMKSYHPYLIRPLSDNQHPTPKEPKKKRFKFRGKSKGKTKSKKHKNSNKKETNNCVTMDAEDSVSMETNGLRVRFTKGNTRKQPAVESKPFRQYGPSDNNNEIKQKN